MCDVTVGKNNFCCLGQLGYKIYLGVKYVKGCLRRSFLGIGHIVMYECGYYNIDGNLKEVGLRKRVRL
jgi:hypothetical protein